MSDDEEYDSGPYCEHWADPHDCQEMCKCGHKCCEHDWLDGECMAEGCNCKEFTDP